MMVPMILAAGLLAAPILSPTAALMGADAATCRTTMEQVRADQAAQLKKLGRLPPGHAEYAVIRRVDGCAVPAPVGYHPPPAKPVMPEN